MSKKQIITVYTDASVCVKTKFAGWAAWIKYGSGPGESFLAAGGMKEPALESTDAELKAIANAVHTVIKRLAPQNAHIVVVTDSMAALLHINGEAVLGKNSRGRTWSQLSSKYKTYHRYKALADSVRAILPEGCTLKANKVKAHCMKDGARSWVNNKVDLAAKAQMKLRRQQG